MSDSESKTTAQEWDQVRTAFKSSIMINTSLSSLAQNLEGPDWPIKAKEETPAAYVELSLDEVRNLLTLKGHPNHLDMLVSLLKDTLSFDDPFGDMVQHTEESAERDNQLIKNMVKLGLSEDFPINLTALDNQAREFCALENMNTLGEFARFAQNMSQNVIVGGDFRKLVNALSHVDESSLAEVLPFRPGSKGLHLIECLAQAEKVGGSIERTQETLLHFKDAWETLQRDLADGVELSRKLVVLNNPAAEKRVAEQLESLLNGADSGKSKDKKSGLSGFFSRLFGK